MSFFTDAAQKELNSNAAVIFDSITDIMHYMDSFGVALDGNLKMRVQKLETYVEKFCKLAAQNKSTHDKVKWQGNMTLIPGVLYAILGIVEEIRTNTGYPFSKLT